MLGVIALLATLALQDPQSAPPPVQQKAAAPDAVPLYSDLGAHHYEVTATTGAQAYFDQGLRLYYAFNHAEAIRSFRAAQRIDPSCAMCWWGEALAWGPNINLPMDSAAGVAGHAAARRALALRSSAGERERGLIDAVAARYAPVPTAANRPRLDSAYAAAMRALASRYPDDQDVAVLYGESLMDLRPWDYWTASGELEPGVRPALAAFERVLQRNPDHPGACHFLIHAVEEVHPERAVPCAERLAALMPGAGHIVHMPGHIYIRVGRYLDAIHANEHAVHADESYIRDQQPAPGMYTVGYYPHNYDFLAFAALMAGRSAQALQATRKAAALIPDELLHAPGYAVLQLYATRPLQYQVAFQHWDEILQAPQPAPDLPLARAIWHYARGRALAARGDAAGAEAELAPLAAAIPALKGTRLDPNDAAAVLEVARHVLAGSVAGARGDADAAIAHLREALRSENALLYGEPPEWSVPVRNELGDALLAAGRNAEAESVFRDGLKRFPENGWSLAGLERALRAQGRTEDADAVAARLRAAWAEADLPLPPARQ